MKLKDLLNVLKCNAKIIDWNTMDIVGEFDEMYMAILDDDFNYVINENDLLEKEVVFVNSADDEIRIGIR